MLDDRMEREDFKGLAESLMQQNGSHSVSESVGKDHPDNAFAKQLFGESQDEVHQQTTTSAIQELDLSALQDVEAPRQSSQTLQEDLVQQAAQALVKDKVDAFLAITGRMSPEEVLTTLQTARQWRRPDDGWQDAFQSEPETNFKFIDRQKPKAKKPNKIEELVNETVQFATMNNIGKEATIAQVLLRLAEANSVPLKQEHVKKIMPKLMKRLQA